MSVKHKVLIVEDDNIIQSIYKKKFTLEGYDVDIAQNGKEGLEKLRSGMPDLVMLDILMPVLDGLQVLSEIRQSTDSAIRNVPVIMLTNISNTSKVKQAIKLGAVGYLVKSDTTPREVVNLVGDTIRKYPAMIRDLHQWQDSAP